jgi:archaellum component FlaC
MERDELMLLGRIDGKIDGIKNHLNQQDDRMDRQDASIKALDERVRGLEQRAAVAGAISGGAISVGIALLAESIKQWMARGSGH